MELEYRRFCKPSPYCRSQSRFSLSTANRFWLGITCSGNDGTALALTCQAGHACSPCGVLPSSALGGTTPGYLVLRQRLAQATKARLASSPATVGPGIFSASGSVPLHIDRPWRGVLPCARPSSRCPSRENREGGANPPRWRHCKRETEPEPTIGTPMGRAWLNPPASQETCLDDQVTTLRSREVTRRPGTRPVLRVMPPAE